MKNRKMVAIGAVAVALGLACGCTEDYRDPKAFAEKYGNEILSARFAEAMGIMSFERFAFSGASVALDRRGNEVVTARVSIVPQSGMKYYPIHRLGVEGAQDWLKNEVPTVFFARHFDGESGEDGILRAKVMMVDAGLGQPLLYDPEPIDAKARLANVGWVRIVRAKDGEGVYRPVGVEDALETYDAENRYTVKDYHKAYREWLPKSAIGEARALEYGSKAADKAIGEYKGAVAKADAMLGAVLADYDAVAKLEQESQPRREKLKARQALLSSSSRSNSQIEVELAKARRPLDAELNGLRAAQKKEVDALRVKVNAKLNETRVAKGRVDQLQNNRKRLTDMIAHNKGISNAQALVQRQEKELADTESQLAAAIPALQQAQGELDALESSKTAMLKLHDEAIAAAIAKRDAVLKEKREDLELQYVVELAEVDAELAAEDGKLAAARTKLRESVHATVAAMEAIVNRNRAESGK